MIKIFRLRALQSIHLSIQNYSLVLKQTKVGGCNSINRITFGWKSMKMDEDRWKWMKVNDSGWKWMTVAESGWNCIKWMKLDENGWMKEDENIRCATCISDAFSGEAIKGYPWGAPQSADQIYNFLSLIAFNHDSFWSYQLLAPNHTFLKSEAQWQRPNYVLVCNPTHLQIYAFPWWTNQ